MKREAHTKTGFLTALIRGVAKFFCPAILLAASSSAAPPPLDLQLVASNLDNPVAITHAGDLTGRLFITLQGGKIVVYDGTNVLATPFMDIGSLISSGGERGLLSVAFSPGYKTNGLFYVDYTNPNSDLVIARYNVSANPNVADAGSGRILLTISHPGQYTHNGGQLQFGPDGYLYASTGDGGFFCDYSGSTNNAQNLGLLLGKLLRLDVSNVSTTYTIPPSNPFVSTNGARPEIWAYGLRNPWRFSFDRVTGDLWIGDVGQATREEVDLQPAASTGGENYGWRLYEGFCTNCCSVTFSNVPTILPVLDYGHIDGACAIMGGYRYRGSKTPPFVGTYVYGDYCSGEIWGATQNVSGVWGSASLLQAGFNISAFGEDEAGELYVAKLASSVGAIYRIVARNSVGDGIPDWWRQQHFGGIGTTTNSNSCASCDPDGDAMSNLQEFFAGTDPTNANDALCITGIQKLNTNTTVISFASVLGKNYAMERCAGLPVVAWVNVATNVPGTGGMMQITNTTVVPSPPQRYFRIKLLSP